jgi:hypothetical protein
MQHGRVAAMRVHGDIRLAATVLLAFMFAVSSPSTFAQSDAVLVAVANDGNVLNVTIPIFDPGIPTDPAEFRDMEVFPRIREIEAKLMPFLLRETLVDSNEWGAVRVVTEQEEAAELQLFGTIVRSDGDWLDLRVRAVDATGTVWLDEVFSDQASDGPDAQQDEDTPAFQEIYTEITNALLLVRNDLGDAAVSNIRNTSLMRYASKLAPTAFGDYLEHNDEGTVRLLRLPSRDDPMLKRIEVIRNTEYLITDTVDTKFREFNANLTHTYRVWRKYRRKLVGYEVENIRFAESDAYDYQPGSWKAIKHQYDAYKYDRITAQEQDRLAVAFNTEVGSTVEAMEIRVGELDGWLDRGYLEWRGLLEELYEVETSLREHGNE